METSSELTLLSGIGSLAVAMAAGLAVVVMQATGPLVITGLFLAQVLGLVAILRREPGQEYGMAGVAVSAVGLASYVTGISF